MFQLLTMIFDSLFKSKKSRPANFVGVIDLKRIQRVDWYSLGAFIIPFLLYAYTLAPTLYNLDSAELTTAVATGGILRATGYPLYLVLGGIWKYLPIGDFGYRLNLFSAFWGAMTIFLAARILRRMHIAPWIRFAALGLLATAPYFWAMSLIAEVYTLHTALMAGVILSLMIWAKSPSPLKLALPVLLISLSMGNHAATVLLIPGFIWFVISQHPREIIKPRVLAATAIAILVGLSVFIYLPWRYGLNPSFNYAGQYNSLGEFVPVDLHSPEGFWWLISGRTFSGQMFGYQINSIWPEIRNFGEQLWIAFFIIGVGPGIVGMIALLKRDKKFGGMLLLLFLANAVFFINYRVIDKNTMYLPAYLVWALWLGIGYQVIFHRVKELTNSKILNLSIASLMIGMVLFAAGWNYSRVNLSTDISTRQQSEEILGMVEPNSIIFGWWDTIPAIQYLQLVESVRPDVLAINRFLISPHEMNRLILNNIDERHIYINNPSIQLLKHVDATKVGHMYLLEEKQ